MKRRRIFFGLLLLCLVFFIAPAQFVAAETGEVTDVMKSFNYADGSFKMSYRLYVPEGAENSGRQYRLVMFLHGAGERGRDNERHVTMGEGFIETMIFTEPYRSDTIVFAPQCPENYRWVERDWSPGEYKMTAEISPALGAAIRILNEEIVPNYSVDTSRLYITGLSMGGMGTWDCIARFPGMFAAAAPVCGAPPAGMLNELAKTPIWTCNDPSDSVIDPTPTVKKIEQLAQIGADVCYKTYTAGGNGHASWVGAYRTDTAPDNLYAFLFSKQGTKYTVTLEDGGEQVVLGEFARGMTVELPAPQGNAESFLGWTDGNNTYPAGGRISVTGEIVLKAVREKSRLLPILLIGGAGILLAGGVFAVVLLRKKKIKTKDDRAKRRTDTD